MRNERESNRKYQSKWYKNHREIHTARVRAVIDRKLRFVEDYKAQRGCDVCDESNPALLKFLFAEGKPAISKVAASRGLDTLKAEMDTRELVCVVCTQLPQFTEARRRRAVQSVQKRNERVKQQLGIGMGAANNKLRRLILLNFAQRLSLDTCYRCGEKIETVEEFSVEHKDPWLDRDAKLFWDMDNIAFSHLKCNRPGLGIDDTVNIGM